MVFWGSPPPCFGPSDAWFGQFNACPGKDIGHDLHKTLLPHAVQTHKEAMVPPGVHVPS